MLKEFDLDVGNRQLVGLESTRSHPDCPLAANVEARQAIKRQGQLGHAISFKYLRFRISRKLNSILDNDNP